MSFIHALDDHEATGRARELFEEDRGKDGYVWNLTRILARKPEVADAWRGLVGAIRGGMDLRRYELATFAAARALHASYCMLAHGRILRDRFLPEPQVAALARDPHGAGLAEPEVAIMDFAAKIATRADTVTQADVEALRRHGLSDTDVMDVALAAAARAFFTKLLDGLGVLPDAAYRSLDEELRNALTVGRPIAPGETR